MLILKRLTVTLSSLDATFTRNWGGGQVLRLVTKRHGRGQSSTNHTDHWSNDRCREGNACHKCPKTPIIEFCMIYRKQGARRFAADF